MTRARLEFRDKGIYSLDFNDIYFDGSQGLEESRFVYSEGFEFSPREHFIIAELGFGVGLNFFLTLQRFLRAKNRPKRLFYVSLEGFYIEKELLREIYQKLGFYEEFKPLLEPFLRAYPRCKDGIYRFYFENAFLDLVFGEAGQSLKELDFKADVWYLDGFKPSVNAEMFAQSTLKEVARLCKKGACILSFSSASSLQRALRANGFLVKKVQGFKKREMVRAIFEGEAEFRAEFDAKFKEKPEFQAEIQNEFKIKPEFCPEIQNKFKAEPEFQAEFKNKFKANTEFQGEPKDKEAYFARISVPHANKRVAIIGSGIAAACLAFELSLRGFEVSVFEKNEALGSGASGNESGILSSLILKKGSPLGEFSEFAFYEASRFYAQVLGIAPSGAVEMAHTEAMKERFATQRDNALFDIRGNRAFLSEAMGIKPRQIVVSLFERAKARLNFGYEFKEYAYEKGEFCLKFKEKAEKKGFGILIYAMGAESKDFLCYDTMKLSAVRGQVTHIKPILQTPYPLSSKGYVCPPLPDLQVIGASYDRLDTDTQPHERDDTENIANVKEFLQNEPEIIGARVGFRSYSSDRFMVCGGFYDEGSYKNAYKDLLWSKKKPQSYPQSALPLYFSLAHGSRGFATAVIAARYLCGLICAEPLFVPKKFIRDIHPARFLIRALKKGLV